MTRKSSLYSLLFTIFNDAIGWGVVLTIFAPLIFDRSYGLMPEGASDSVRNITVGFLIGAYAVTQFVSMPFIGALSDHFGRKRVLEWTILGATISFILSGIAILIGSLSLLFAMRLLAGLFSGNSGTAQASIADMSTDQTKAKNLSLSGVVGGISWILGPPLGGFLASSSWVSWFNFATPFWFLGVLFLINLVWIHKSYEETHKSREKHSWKQEIKDLGKFSKMPRMNGWLLVSFLFYVGWFFFILYYPTLLVQKFGYSQQQIGFLSGYLAIFWFSGSLILNRGLAEKFKPEMFILWALPICGIVMIITSLFETLGVWLVTFPMLSLCATSIWICSMALTSNIAGKENQGKVFGVIQSLQSLGLFISPICTGFLALANINFPFWVGAAIILATSCIAFRLHSSERKA